MSWVEAALRAVAWRASRTPLAFLVALAGCEGQIMSPPIAESALLQPARPGVEPPGPTLPEFTSAQTCSGCHPRQAAEWQESAHSHAMTDPVFQALVARATRDDPESRAFCLSCHSNVGTVAGALGPALTFESFDPMVMEGVTCESCHRMTDVYRPSNAGHVLDPTAPMQGSVRAGDGSPYHETERSAVLGTAEFCASCHDVDAPSGFALEQPYVEWSSGPARSQGLLCVDCHMPKSYGPAAEGFGLAARPVRSHRFSGPGALTMSSELGPERQAELGAEVQAQLAHAVSISVRAPEPARDARASLEITLQNNVLGHRFPTGSAFFRRVWLQVTVDDGAGARVFEAQAPDPMASGFGPEQRALLLSARLLDDTGAPTLFPWRAASLDNDGALEPLEVRSMALAFDVPASARGPLSARVSLQFQSFSDSMLRELDMPSDASVTLEIASAGCSIELLEDAL
jgi:hypothetical protein